MVTRFDEFIVELLLKTYDSPNELSDVSQFTRFVEVSLNEMVLD